MAECLESTTDDGMTAPAPQWIRASLEVNEGRDPLGLQTTTQDRLMPVLLPGILELTRRARYFSFHAFLLHEYRQRRLLVDSTAQSTFIRRREWDFGLAVERCGNCDSSPVGAQRLGALSRGDGPFPRGESVESSFGGYGLYYRSPMAELGLVARRGTMLGDQPILIDVLYDTPRAQRLAAEFRAAVAGTAYYRDAMWTSHELAAEVIDEYAEVACLCRLRERVSERDAVHDAVFGTDPDVDMSSSTLDALPPSALTGSDPAIDPGSIGEGVAQRRRSVAHYLTLLRARPDVVESESTYRDSLWAPAALLGDAHAVVAGQWAALVAKDVWQEALCSVWSEFCRAGVARYRELGRGLTWDEARQTGTALTTGPPLLDGAVPMRDLVRAVSNGTLSLTGSDGMAINVADAPLDTLRSLTAELNTATSALVVLLELARRMADRAGSGWMSASHIASGWQPSVAAVINSLQAHLEENPSVGDTLWWLVSRFVEPVHQRIAYSKLPEFTFRFRWEEGLLRFYDHGKTRFPLAAIRRSSLASISHDLGLWDQNADDVPSLTDRGERFVAEVFI